MFQQCISRIYKEKAKKKKKKKKVQKTKSEDIVENFHQTPF